MYIHDVRVCVYIKFSPDVINFGETETDWLPSKRPPPHRDQPATWLFAPRGTESVIPPSVWEDAPINGATQPGQEIILK